MGGTMPGCDADVGGTIRRVPWTPGDPPAQLLDVEWLVADGQGGFAAGTVAWVPTRRQHGLLVAALPPPAGRVRLLAGLEEVVVLPGGRRLHLGGRETAGVVDLPGVRHLVEFRLEDGLPCWRYDLGDHVLERLVHPVHGQGATGIRWHLAAGRGPVLLEARPLLPWSGAPWSVEAAAGEDGLRLALRPPATREAPTWLRLVLGGAGTAWMHQPELDREAWLRKEVAQGYEARDPRWSPGLLVGRLAGREPLHLVAAAGSVEVGPRDGPLLLQGERERRSRLVAAAEVPSGSVEAELVLAADAFLVQPPGRRTADGQPATSIVAGYPWFTDWGRDAMIALEGLCACTGRVQEGARVLRAFLEATRDGLLPNLFPEGAEAGTPGTADATLWAFHALDRLLGAGAERRLLESLLPLLREIVDHHREGTVLGIVVDPADGLLRQGEEGWALTWMDARFEGVPITPRAGKAVEVNALWYNALRRVQAWEEVAGDPARARRAARDADRVQASFNERFWFAEGPWLYDLVDGGPHRDQPDPALRPNQLLAIALPHPVLDRGRWGPVMDAVQTRLVTPRGLRSLDPHHADYQGRYSGDLRSRDAAYHQGTAWGWLVGPWLDARRRMDPSLRPEEDPVLSGLLVHMDEAGFGTLGEVFDGDPPHRPGGCVAQAWTVAEVLRHLRWRPPAP